LPKSLAFAIYLDRYCINQEQREEFSEQVQKINLIYQNAEVTIIAAAGEDPTYGLPGVNHYRKRDPRISTTCTKIGKHFLISAGLHPHWSIYILFLY
jgi:Heterokaryon incompatibility protein (HET)